MRQGERNLGEGGISVPEDVEIFVDGACSGNPGTGGWAYLVKSNDGDYTDSGAEGNTTSNRMEMTAAIKALESLSEPCRVSLYSDSEYLVKGMTEWLYECIARGWRTSDKKALEHQDLWQRLLELTGQTLWRGVDHIVEWIQVPADASHPENERVNNLAQEAIRQYLDG
jgi:ribonuclease HI